MGACQGPAHIFINQYKKCCQIFFKAIIVLSYACNTSSLIDHIITNSSEKIFQSGIIIDCGISDHQLIFCTRKLKPAKLNRYNNLFLSSLKQYTVNAFVEELQKVSFSSHAGFSCTDTAYTDFVNKLNESR